MYKNKGFTTMIMLLMLLGAVVGDHATLSVVPDQDGWVTVDNVTKWCVTDRGMDFQVGTTYTVDGVPYSWRVPGRHIDVLADEHLIANGSYRATIEAIIADDPDLVISLGDTAMIQWTLGHDAKTPEEMRERWLAVRRELDGLRCPYIQVLGNHDGEWGDRREMADAARREYIPSLPGRYYTVDLTDAQLIVLDPYWYGWLDLGEEQTAWVTSLPPTPRWRIAVTHTLTTSCDVNYGRGSVMPAIWPHVNLTLKGHDHGLAKDGDVVLCPQPQTSDLGYTGCWPQPQPNGGFVRVDIRALRIDAGPFVVGRRDERIR